MAKLRCPYCKIKYTIPPDMQAVVERTDEVKPPQHVIIRAMPDSVAKKQARLALVDMKNDGIIAPLLHECIEGKEVK